MLVIVVSDERAPDIKEVRFSFEKFDASASALLSATIEQGDKYVSVYWESK